MLLQFLIVVKTRLVCVGCWSKKAVGVKNKEVTCFLQVLFGYIGDLSYILPIPIERK